MVFADVRYQYANPQVLHDITNGSNPGCGTQGFKVAKGWDPGKCSCLSQLLNHDTDRSVYLH